MRRSYRRERYLGWLERIRAAMPDIAVSTDIIVGFPGETERDFAQTLEVVEAARFDSAYTFQYSPRPGTRAASFDEQVPKPVVQERFDRLVALQERISEREGGGRCWAATVEVLVEGGDRKRTLDPVEDAHEPHRAPARRARRRARSCTARIVAAAPHHLTGELVREPAAATG